VNNNSVTGNVWSNPGNASGAPGSLFAEVFCLGGTVTTREHSQYLFGSNLTFDSTDIPDGATVTGILAGLTLSIPTAADGAGIGDHARLFIAGAVAGNDKGTSFNVPATAGVVQAGGAGDAWGTTPTPAQVRSSNFGFGVAIRGGTSASTSLGADAKGMFMQVLWSM
jgi:hypothetical protein